MTTAWSKSLPTEPLIANRFRSLGELGEDPLGKLLRAQDTQNNNETVRLLKLKQFLTRLPTQTQSRLQAAAKEASNIGIKTLLKVREHNFTDLYLVTDWLEGDTTLRQWGDASAPKRPAVTVIGLVAGMANALNYVQKSNFIWLKPSLDPDKIYVQRDPTDLAGEYPVLVDLGFAELLLDNPAYANGAPFDAQATIHQLAVLLVSLLLGKLELRNADWQDAAVVEARVNEIWQRHTDLPTGLGRVLRPALATYPSTLYADLSEFVEALEKLAPPTKPRPPAVAGEQVAAPRSVAPSPGATGTGAPAPVAPGEGKYQLRIYDTLQRGEIFFVELKDTVVTVGGSSDGGVNLGRLTAQRLYFVRQNGRLGDRYTVTDTGNGATQQQFALLDGVPLSPYYAALFPAYTKLTIAGYQIELLPALASVATRPPQPTPPLQLAVHELAGQPGERLSLSLRIQNQTREVDRFWLVLDGAPAAWQVVIPPAHQLFDGEEFETLVTIRLPSIQQSVAQLYPLTLRLISENLTAQIAAVNLHIELLPAYDFVGMLTPERLRARAVGKVYLENQGNLSRIFHLTWRDHAQELLFDPSDTTLMVRTGEVGEVVYRAYLRQWRWLGREKSHTVNVVAAPQGGGLAQTYTGQVISRALIPAWALPVLLLVIVGFLLLAALFFKPEFAQRTVGPDNMAVVGTPVTLYWTAINSCFYSVYEDGVVQRQFSWQPRRGRYEVNNPQSDKVTEVRIRNCLFMAERSWQVTPVTPTPMPTAPPQIVNFTITSSEPITPALHFLLGQIGDLCFTWDVTGIPKDLKLEPPVAELQENTGKKCVAVAKAFEEEKVTDFRLVATTQDDQRIESAPIAVTVLRARCYVNTFDPIALYEGPGRMFPVRGYLRKEKLLFVLAKPFALFEEQDPDQVEEQEQDQWVQATLADDPRPGWVLLNYLYCPQDIKVLPVVGAVPPTPTPEPTLTPTPTPTPTPTATPPPPLLVSVAPEVINLGGCALLKWEIQNVKEVYLDDEGVVGVGEREVCPATAGRITYTWRVVQLDGNTIKLERQLLVNPGSDPGGPLPPPVQ